MGEPAVPNAMQHREMLQSSAVNQEKGYMLVAQVNMDERNGDKTDWIEWKRTIEIAIEKQNKHYMCMHLIVLIFFAYNWLQYSRLEAKHAKLYEIY